MRGFAAWLLTPGQRWASEAELLITGVNPAMKNLEREQRCISLNCLLCIWKDKLRTSFEVPQISFILPFSATSPRGRGWEWDWITYELPFSICTVPSMDSLGWFWTLCTFHSLVSSEHRLLLGDGGTILSVKWKSVVAIISMAAVYIFSHARRSSPHSPVAASEAEVFNEQLQVPPAEPLNPVTWVSCL